MPQLISPHSLSRGYLDINSLPIHNFTIIEDANLIEKPESLVIKEYKEPSSIYYILTDLVNDYILSIMRLKKINLNNELYYKIDKSKSFIERQGYATVLYEYAFCHCNLPIISDKIQTKPGSSDLWKKFQKKQEQSNYEILVLNVETNHKGLFTTRDYSDYRVWGWDMDFIALIEDTPDLLYDALDQKDISKELFLFINNNPNRIRNRENILLIGRKKNI